MSRVFAADKDTIDRASKERVLYNPLKMILKPAKVNQAFGFIFPLGLGTSPIFIGGPLTVYYFFGMIILFMAAYTTPLRELEAENKKGGKPVFIIMQAGTFIIDFVTRYFKPKLLVEPRRRIDPETGKEVQGYMFEEYCKTVDGDFSITDENGEIIQEGQWMPPESFLEEVAEIKTEAKEEKEKTSRWKNISDRLKMYKRRIYASIFLAVLLYLFQHWVSYGWQILMAFLWW